MSFLEMSYFGKLFYTSVRVELRSSSCSHNSVSDYADSSFFLFLWPSYILGLLNHRRGTAKSRRSSWHHPSLYHSVLMGFRGNACAQTLCSHIPLSLDQLPPHPHCNINYYRITRTTYCLIVKESTYMNYRNRHEYCSNVWVIY